LDFNGLFRVSRRESGSFAHFRVVAMEAIWRRIEAWFRLHAPAALSELQPGASADRIAQAESAMGLRFPEAMRASYRIHDGSGLLRLFPEGRLMELVDAGNGVVYEWNVWRSILEEGDLPEVGVPPEGPIQAVRWNMRWIPLTDVGQGNHYCVDLDPAPGGRVGQIIWYHHERGAVRVVAPGFAEWLARYAAGLEGGLYSLGLELEMRGPKEPI
jgi:cell wall assembly regulator SMI1